MKCECLLTAALFFIAGCNGPAGVDLNAREDEQTSVADAGNDETVDMVFNLSNAAAPELRAAMASVPDGTHLVVFVDVDDEKYCTGFHYNLQVMSNPSKTRFVMTESNGIQLAIEKDDVKFLDGTTLDYATLSSGTSGFVFRNPNENVSLPSELRDKE